MKSYKSKTLANFATAVEQQQGRNTENDTRNRSDNNDINTAPALEITLVKCKHPDAELGKDPVVDAHTQFYTAIITFKNFSPRVTWYVCIPLRMACKTLCFLFNNRMELKHIAFVMILSNNRTLIYTHRNVIKRWCFLVLLY